ncbi:hypothetical protein GCM10010193_56680 [Kitasatospora atroaurantiaca]
MGGALRCGGTSAFSLLTTDWLIWRAFRELGNVVVAPRPTRPHESSGLTGATTEGHYVSR